MALKKYLSDIHNRKKFLDYLSFNNGGFGQFQKNGIWFFGIERAGGLDIQDGIEAIKSIEDITPSLQETDLDKWTDRKKNAGTWRGLIKIFKAICQDNSEDDDFIDKNFTKNGHVLLELFPLKCADADSSTFEKTYSECSTIEGLEFLASRKQYEKYVFEQTNRVQHYQNLIKQYAPKVIVLYGKSKQDFFLQLCGLESDDFHTKKYTNSKGKEYEYQILKKENTVYAIVNHPTSFGFSDDYCNIIGNEICKRLQKK